MNVAPLRKTILKETVLFTVLLVIFAGVAIYLGMMRDEYFQQKNEALAMANRLLAEKQEADAKFMAVKDSMDVFEESVRWAKNPGLFIDSQAIRDFFNVYQAQFFLKKLSVEMQPIADMTDDPKFVRKHFIGTKAGIKISIEALSDEDIYGVIRSMQKDLPGFIKITSISLVKKDELSKEVLAVVRKEGSYALVTCELFYEWYGIKSTDADSNFNKYIPKKREGVTP